MVVLAVYLVVTRNFGCRPRRRFVDHRLSNRELMQEMELRGLTHADCVERTDLLDVLCGPQVEKPDKDDQRQFQYDASYVEDEYRSIDKVV